MNSLEKISVIVPIRNEVGTLELLVKRISDSFLSSNIKYKIIFVDFDSQDGTTEKLVELAKNYPVEFHAQIGKGKANAIIEGVEYADTEYVVMIDGDLQYPPEAIPEMIKLINDYPVVVADRVESKDTLYRRILSKSLHFIFSKLLFGFDCDVQSGLKLFPKRLIDSLDISYITPWTFDLALLYTAQKLGYKIGSVPIVFAERVAGETKVNVIGSIKEHVISCLKFKLNPPKIKQ